MAALLLRHAHGCTRSACANKGCACCGLHSRYESQHVVSIPLQHLDRQDHARMLGYRPGAPVFGEQHMSIQERWGAARQHCRTRSAYARCAHHVVCYLAASGIRCTSRTQVQVC
jgi:hypothetical protein